jgi:CspA family cold shock protein
MAQGRVKWYSAALGYGFIIPDDGGTELFVQRKDIASSEPKPLENGDKVTYKAVQGAEGVEAKNVSRV